MFKVIVCWALQNCTNFIPPLIMAIELVTCAKLFLFICYYIRSCGGQHFGFHHAVLFVTIFLRNVLLPSSGWLNWFRWMLKRWVGRKCVSYTPYWAWRGRQCVPPKPQNKQNTTHGVKIQNTHHHLNNHSASTENMETYTFSLVLNILPGEGSFCQSLHITANKNSKTVYLQCLLLACRSCL
jgi:hypothetical protein